MLQKLRTLFTGTLKRFFLTYLLMILIPMMVFGSFAYRWSRNEIIRQTERVYEELLTRIGKSVDENFVNVDNLYYALGRMSWVSTMAEMPVSGEYVSSYFMREKQMELANLLSSQPMLEEAQIFFVGTDLVLSRSGVENIGMHLSHTRRYNDLSLENWRQILDETYSGRFIYLQTKYKGIYPDESGLMLYIKTLPIFTDKNVQLVVCISKQAFTKMLTSSHKNNTLMFIADQENGFVFAPDSDFGLASELINIDLSQKIVRDESGSAYYLFHTNSITLPWDYYAAVPVNVIQSNAYQMRLFMFVVATLTFLIGSLVALQIARRNYRPLGELVHLASGLLHEPTVPDNEFMFLERTFMMMDGQRQAFSERLDQSAPMIQQTLLFKLMMGLVEGHDLNKSALEAKLPLKTGFWTVALANSKSVVQIPPLELKLPEGWMCHPIDLSEHTLAFVFYTLWCDAERLSSLINKYIGIEENVASVCIGRSYPELSGLRQSYLDARVLENTLDVSREKTVISYERELNRSELQFFMPDSVENEIYNRIQLRDAKKVKVLMQEIFENNRKHLSLLSMRCMCYRLLSVGLRVVSKYHQDYDFSVAERQLQLTYTLKEALDIVSGVYDELLLLLPDMKETANARTAERMMSYIRENHRNPELSLEMVAEAFSMSSSYVSRFFKDQSGEAFLDYLTRVRVEDATELLAYPELSVAAVAETVGYMSAATFRSALKRIHGITPDDYRRKSCHE